MIPKKYHYRREGSFGSVIAANACMAAQRAGLQLTGMHDLKVLHCGGDATDNHGAEYIVSKVGTIKIWEVN